MWCAASVGRPQHITLCLTAFFSSASSPHVQFMNSQYIWDQTSLLLLLLLVELLFLFLSLNYRIFNQITNCIFHTKKRRLCTLFSIMIINWFFTENCFLVEIRTCVDLLPTIGATFTKSLASRLNAFCANRLGTSLSRPRPNYLYTLKIKV